MYDQTYDDSYDSSGSSDILASIFDSAAQVGSAYFASQTPQTAPLSPYGAINPATGRPYQAMAPSSTSPLLLIGILGLVGYVAFKALK